MMNLLSKRTERFRNKLPDVLQADEANGADGPWPVRCPGEAGRHRLPATIAFMLTCMIFVLPSRVCAAPPRQELWNEVKAAQAQGLPKTAIEKLAKIIEESMADKSYAEAVKAIGMKIVSEATIQGNKPEDKITRMTAEIKAAPDEMKPVMQVILANWYWQYFQSNRWRYMQRTDIASAPSDDITEWTLPQILAQIDTQFQSALSAAKSLQSTPVGQWDELLEKGELPDAYRPTMYDFLVYNAIDFYSAGEQAGSRSQHAFDLSADSPIFASSEEFIAWTPQSDDQHSPTLRAISLYQDLLRFHAGDKDPSARIDADLARLVFGHNQAFGEEKSARYKAALRRLMQSTSDHPLSASAAFRLAQELFNEEDRVGAHQVASGALAQFPDSAGGTMCFNLIQQIEAPESNIVTERVWNQAKPKIEVAYRNVTEVHFRLIPFAFADLISSNRHRVSSWNELQRLQLMQEKPLRSWSANLPATDDYQLRRETITAPGDVAPGAYLLISSHNPEFRDTDNTISIAEVWVSKLALITRVTSGQGAVEGFVLDAESGNPISGAKVQAWHLVRNDQRGTNFRYESLPDVKTDRNGMFEISGTSLRSLILMASHGGHSLSNTQRLSIHQNTIRERTDELTTLFTDRALYRPGQTVRYKGVCWRSNQATNDYGTIANRTVSVVFRDSNHNEIARVDHRTNDFGSFSGSFTAPSNRGTGAMSLHVENGPQGQAQVQVEEYKRPKFKVAFETPQTPVRLGQKVTLSGVASAYTGAAIDNATVSYRVVRQMNYPGWWWMRCWWMPPIHDSGTEIDHGTVTTGADGKFEISFDARPDASANAEGQPSFRFTIDADVTDSTGETRSDQTSVTVGFVSLVASISLDAWLTSEQPVTLGIKTSSLDGKGQSAAGTIVVHALEQPKAVVREAIGHITPEPRFQPRSPRDGDPAAPSPEPDLSNPNSWPIGDQVFSARFETDGAGAAKVPVALKAGIYRTLLKSTDDQGNEVTATEQLIVIDPKADKFNVRVADHLVAADESCQPGETFQAVWGTGYDSGRAYIEVLGRDEVLQSFWTAADRTQVAIQQAVDESMRGGLMLRVTMVRENQAHMHQMAIDVPWNNKKLDIRWERFTSKLKPGQQEKWSAIIQGNDAMPAAAEMLAVLYDASLDAYRHHSWPSHIGQFRHNYQLYLRQSFENQATHLEHFSGHWSHRSKAVNVSYRRFPDDVLGGHWNMHRGFGWHMRGLDSGLMRMSAPVPRDAMPEAAVMDDALELNAFAKSAPAAPEYAASAASVSVPGGAPARGQAGNGKGNGEPKAALDFDSVAPRKNLQETAFFFPHLIAGDDGTVRLEFTMPEALTQWKFMGLAHDSQLRSGMISDSVVTAKDLMVQPNAPRFVREGDVLEMTVKVSNQSPTRQSGSVRLSFADARTGDAVDSALGNADNERSFDIAAGQSQGLAWRIKIPDAQGVLTYRAVGSTGRLSDGEEGFLPVLSRRVLVTESIALPVRGKQTRQFEFQRLKDSGESDSLRYQSLTVQMVSNPSWYAVMALPYLMEYPHECSEQSFNRLYANALARHIASSNPKIGRVFEQWRGTPALDSPLMQNQDLKSVMIEETPWLIDAQNESQSRRNVGILFDTNRLNDETERLMQRLAQLQLPDGSWPWFPGARANDYITLYITTGFGRMRHLGIEVDTTMAVKSCHRLDAWMTDVYQKIRPEQRDESHLSNTIALYLYGRSFFLKDSPIAPEHRVALDYFVSQAQQHWLKLDCRQSQAHLAVALKRLGKLDAAKQIMQSLHQRSVSSDEMGMYWAERPAAYWWRNAPIETQAMMIEAFDEVMDDAQAVRECQVWLLKQKQTQNWKTTKATADAVYALLLRGTDSLASDSLVQVSLGGKPISPEAVQAGTGFYETRFTPDQISPEQGDIQVVKEDSGIAWGSVHLQYLEDINKITPHDGTELQLTKQLFVKHNTDSGPVLKPIDGPVSVGDELVVRIVLRADRDMEYIHMKDHRGSGTEPVNVLSRYRYQDGLGYYESTRDTASHFFIEYLPKGTYVFEYSTRVQLRGTYPSGMATIQCMYAPEFNSHSQSIEIEAR